MTNKRFIYITMDIIIVLDFGGQYCHLIARRIRDLGTYSEILPYDVDVEVLKAKEPKGIILSGGPSSVYEDNSPQLSQSFYDYVIKENIPVLGICYGHHLLIHQLKGKIEPYEVKEYGKTVIIITQPIGILKGLDNTETVWMSHGDQIEELPNGFKSLAKTETCPIAVYGNEKMKFYGVQFHPEVAHTPKGNIILDNFIEIANAKKEWKLENWIEQTIEDIKEKVGQDNRVILGLSGGVDSSVTAILIYKAIGDRLHSIFVNNGVLRKKEENEVQETFKEKLEFKNFHYVDAEKLFLDKLEGVEDPEEKRKV
ncbi:MAG TPA: glutamine-hydrolyzing GMP synthase, partial [bacterium]|nr:glutamine-hydrolyzing GMP synthase [bacterium]